MSAPILISISPGELIDRMTILKIKADRITDEASRQNANAELEALSRIQRDAMQDSDELRRLWAELKSANEALWMINDDIRDCEARKDFGAKFIELARGISVTNDERAILKEKIDALAGVAALAEEKFYVERNLSVASKTP